MGGSRMTCSNAGPPINPCVACGTGNELEVSSSESKPKLHLKLDAKRGSVVSLTRGISLLVSIFGLLLSYSVSFRMASESAFNFGFLFGRTSFEFICGAHLMQWCIGQPSQQIRASAPYTNPAPMNNNMLHTQMSGVIGGQASSPNLISYTC
ncbi:hypothetical protein V6N12_058763 [Hibiscus sabdariffa]|uniref:Uncharacterized protein n=1 Tax=Hibiscus sabdariffa TaxID=183260 RepID=A0ABR2ETJ0_9ROSI